MSEDVQGTQDNPGVVAPPPLLYAGGLVAGLLVNRVYPIPFLPRGLSRALGWPSILAGLVIGSLGLREMKRAGTDVDPREPTTAIVTGGPYRFTRNPLYLSMTLIFGGVSTLANARPALLLLPVILYVMRRGVIEREERYLERKFGDEYLDYKARVGRRI